MPKKKITVSEDFLIEVAPKEALDDISLKFNLQDAYHSLNVDLTNLGNGTLERRKELNKFKVFLINSSYSLATKKNYYKIFKKFVLTVNESFTHDIIGSLKKYNIILQSQLKSVELSDRTYSLYVNSLETIVTKCYGVKEKDLINVFPKKSKRTSKIVNSTILDASNKEKAFSKTQFREIGKIFFQLHDLFDSLLNERPKEKYSVNFKYQDIYNLEIDLHWSGNYYLQNRKSFCLMIVFISLTGINLAPLIRMKRSDILIDKERKTISFQAVCHRKGSIQNHNYPMREAQLKFFEKIIENSLSISPTQDILFPFVYQNSNISYFSHHISKCYEFFNKGFCGEYSGINITARKLRHSFGSQFEDIDLRSVALFNNINTAAKYYSNGNSSENNEQLQNAMNIYTLALSNSKDIQSVRENIKTINTIQIKDIASLKEANSQITSSGIFCLNSKEGKEAETFKRKIDKLQLENLDNINCANILACFNCKNSIIVNDFENVYLLKSFYNYLNNIVYESNTSSLFSDENAVKNAMLGIQIVLDTKIDAKIIKKVNKHISINGNHPLWDFNGSFL